MGTQDKANWVVAGLFGSVAAILLLLMAGVSWYKAGVKAELWRREGAEITQWEVFVGAQPLTRKID